MILHNILQMQFNKIEIFQLRQNFKNTQEILKLH